MKEDETKELIMGVFNNLETFINTYEEVKNDSSPMLPTSMNDSSPK